MGYIKGHERGQSVLFPSTVDEYIAENNAVRAIAAFLGRLDFVKLGFVRGRAAETGSAQALFALAETFDPAVLSAWGTFGTQGDVTKAQELYAKAFAGGVQEAKDRLVALRQ